MLSGTRQKSLSTSVRALYDIYLIHLKSNICSISSLCLMCLVPAAIKPRINSRSIGIWEYGSHVL